MEEGRGSEGAVLGRVAGVEARVVVVVVLLAVVVAVLAVVVVLVALEDRVVVVRVLEEAVLVVVGGIVGEKEVVVSVTRGAGFWTTTVPVDGLLWIRFHHGTFVVVGSAVEAVEALTPNVVVVVVLVAVVVVGVVVVVVVVVLKVVVVVLVDVVAGDVIGSLPPFSVSPEET